jgi:diguanylate cyclase (GGDEF)-like protein
VENLDFNLRAAARSADVSVRYRRAMLDARLLCRNMRMHDSARRRIIVVEDDAATRKLLQRQLETAGYEVAAYEDGRQALAGISELGSGVVLADWTMPVMDGLELCQAVRELEQLETLGQIYYILLTAKDSKEHTVTGLEAGANDYLTKPYHIGELLARIAVGERFLGLQRELLKRTIEYQKANAQLALLGRKLEELANTDALTGLATRRYVLDRFEEVWDVAERQSRPLSLIMLDIDSFKGVNDRYGHNAGDQVLRDVSEITRRLSGRPDLCGRIGGEELIIVCPDMTCEQAVRLAEEIRVAVSQRATICGQTVIAVTVSCGVAQMGAQIATSDELFKRVDAMMYAAKTHGRNQTWHLAPDGEPHAAKSHVATR